MTYEQWMAAIDRLVQARVGMSLYDLPDFPSRDLYDEGVEPEEALESVADFADMGEDFNDFLLGGE